MTTLQTAKIEWRDGGVPVSHQFDDPYFSIVDGLAETQHVFLGGNDLPQRFRPGFHIGELGFGTGLNLIMAWKAWVQSGQTGPLHFTSFEAFPMSVDDMQMALSAFPQIERYASSLLEALGDGQYEIHTDTLCANVVIGDARTTVPEWSGCADAWFLDGFSPAKNPELWDKDLLSAVATHTNPGGSCATYSAAGHVRRNLGDVGFVVERVPGFGRKRHMTVGHIGTIT